MAKKILQLVCSGGCHTCQLLELKRRLGDRYYYEYLICRGYDFQHKDLPDDGPKFFIDEPRGKRDNKVVAAFKTVRCFFQTWRAIRKSRADAIITTGPGAGFVAAFVGKKLFRKKIIYITDECRVYSLSSTCRLMRRFKLPDLWFVQWPELAKEISGAKYAGRFF